MNSGSCLCGKIQFKVLKFMPAVAHCHCTMCRKFHGAAFSTFAEVSLDDLVIDSGEELLQSYHATNGTVRKFCKCCGSSLMFESSYNRRDNTIEIALSAFDNIEHIEPNAHIYVSSKVRWLELQDELPKYPYFRE